MQSRVNPVLFTLTALSAGRSCLDFYTAGLLTRLFLKTSSLPGPKASGCFRAKRRGLRITAQDYSSGTVAASTAFPNRIKYSYLVKRTLANLVSLT